MRLSDIIFYYYKFINLKKGVNKNYKMKIDREKSQLYKKKLILLNKICFKKSFFTLVNNHIF